MSKLFFYDLETTGVKDYKHGIHQMSGMIVIDGVEKERFNLKMQPNPKAVIDDEALKIANVTKADLETYMLMEEGYKALMQIVAKYVDRYNKKDKFHLVGYNNASFDNHFLRAFFLQNGDSYFGSYFWADSIDCMVLASNVLKDARPNMLNFKLSTVAKQLGIEVDESRLHDALYDIELTKAVYDLTESFF